MEWNVNLSLNLQDQDTFCGGGEGSHFKVFSKFFCKFDYFHPTHSKIGASVL